MNRSAVIAIFATILLVASCGDDSKGESSKTESSKTASVIRYDGGVRLLGPDDVDKLKDAPDDFKTFIASEVEQEQADADTSCDAQPSITVKVIDSSRFASGDVTQCKATRTIWVKGSGGWAEVFRQNSLLGCEDAVQYNLPVSVAGKTCLNSFAGEEPYKP